MEDSQTEYVGMFIKVKTFLNKKAAALTATPIIASTIAPALSAKIDEIEEEAGDASSPTTGTTELKRNLQKDVVDRSFTVGAACAAYYTITVPNPELRVKFELDRSDFERLRDNDIFVEMKHMHALADTIKTLLVPYGVAAADVDALGAALTTYFEKIQAPKDAIDARAASGEQVDRLILQAREILDKQLDVVMKVYFTGNPELYGYYQHARAIDSTGGGPIPDEDETITMASGTFDGGPFSSAVNANTRIVITSPAANGSNLNVGFSNILGGFSSPPTVVLPGTTGDFKAVDLGFTTGIANFNFQNPGMPAPGSITFRIKVFY